MKGTRLWQAPGSPIIQGRSRTERPFWQGWAGGALGAEALFWLVASFFAFVVSQVSLGAAMSSAAGLVIVPALPACVAGAALGAWLSRTMGWRRPLLAGTVFGAIVAGVVVAVS